MKNASNHVSPRVAIVTGAANGIGRAIALELFKRGVRVLAVDIDGPALEALRTGAGENLQVLQGSATEAGVAKEAVERAVLSWGSADILVNNVGGRIGGAGLDATEQEWEQTVRLSLTSHYLWSQAVVGLMKQAGWGRIVNICSNAGVFRSNTGMSGLSYSAAKGGVAQLTRSLAHEVGRLGINVNAVAPGSVLSPAGIEEERELGPELMGRIRRETPLGYFAPPEEIALIVAFLASEDASYVTGVTILANGGWCTS